MTSTQLLRMDVLMFYSSSSRLTASFSSLDYPVSSKDAHSTPVILDTILVVSSKLEEHHWENAPPYACLSHRWSLTEVSYQQWQLLDELYITLRDTSGYSKVVAACRITNSMGIPYLWADTCCIDKSSSAELSEAINSMWTWYKSCVVCLAYLADVTGEEDSSSSEEGPAAATSNLGSSEWFRRSWTLQELIAPASVVFFDANWERLGDKIQLAHEITKATEIQEQALLRFEYADWSNAQMMSWAADRKATRIEDVAYSLLGLFDVNMPLLYGEGEKAFTRLQQEITRTSIGETLLAWQEPQAIMGSSLPLFAQSPAAFKGCGNVAGVPYGVTNKLTHEEISLVRPSSLSNLGLELDLLAVPWRMNTFQALVAIDATDVRFGYFATLRRIANDNVMERIANGSQSTIRMPRDEGDIVHLLDCHKVLIVSKPDYTIRGVSYNGMVLNRALPSFFVTSGPHTNIWPAQDWDPYLPSAFMMGEGSKSIGLVALWLPEPLEDDKGSMIIKLGFDRDFSPMCSIRHTQQPHHELVALAAARNTEVWETSLLTSTYLRAWEDRVTHKYSVVESASGETIYVYKSIDRLNFRTSYPQDITIEFGKHKGAWQVDLRCNEDFYRSF